MPCKPDQHSRLPFQATTVPVLWKVRSTPSWIRPWQMPSAPFGHALQVPLSRIWRTSVSFGTSLQPNPFQGPPCLCFDRYTPQGLGAASEDESFVYVLIRDAAILHHVDLAFYLAHLARAADSHRAARRDHQPCGLCRRSVRRPIPESMKRCPCLRRGVRRGGTFVTARVDDTLAPEAEAILQDLNRVDLAARRGVVAQEGWTRFGENATLTRSNRSNESATGTAL